jgi:hypothetical protein
MPRDTYVTSGHTVHSWLWFTFQDPEKVQACLVAGLINSELEMRTPTNSNNVPLSSHLCQGSIMRLRREKIA